MAPATRKTSDRAVAARNVIEPQYTTAEAAELTRQSRRSMYRAMSRGDIRYVKLPGSGAIRISESAIADYLSQTGTGPEAA